MLRFNGHWLLALTILEFLVLSVPYSHASREIKIKTKSAVFHSPKFELEPGSVVNKDYYNIDFPRGHIGLKEFNAEVVDEYGNSIPLHETYLHHWVVIRYFHLKNSSKAQKVDSKEHNKLEYKMARNSGVCQKEVLGQYYGLGSETRKTATYVPDPYGIEIGNSAEIPEGYEEIWMLNVHAIDTRGVEDRLGCTECRCDLYNVTKDGYGRPLRPEYKGGLSCCVDGTKCKVREGVQSVKRSLYLRYSVKWVDWNDFILPAKIYIFDVTDTWKPLNDSSLQSAEHNCMIEYNVESCGAIMNHQCIDNKRTKLSLPNGGYVIYAVAHQHIGSVGSSLYGEDGRVICSSSPIYGKGKEAGNEAGYIVGMTTCYPQLGSIKIRDGERLTLESNYNSSHIHTGVMGLFYVLVADQLPNSIFATVGV